MTLAPKSGFMIVSDNCHWIYSAFGAMKDAKNKHCGCILLCGEELRLNVGGFRRKKTPI